MSGSKDIPNEAPESIMIGVSDAVKKIDLGIELPEQGHITLGILKKSIQRKGIEKPILVRADGAGGYEILDGWRRLQICRELGKDCPATLLKNIGDARAREITLEENLNQRSMSKKTRIALAFQLRKEFNYSDSKIAKFLGVHQTTISRLFQDKKPKKRTEKDFHKMQCENIAIIESSIRIAMKDLGVLRTALREDAKQIIGDLQDRVHRLL